VCALLYNLAVEVEVEVGGCALGRCWVEMMGMRKRV